MFKKDKQTCLLSANRGKKYVAPYTSVISVELSVLLAGSGPEATIEDINYGGDLTQDTADQ